MRYDRLLDVANSITHLDEFVQACLYCWQHRVEPGIYHVTNGGAITTREVTGLIRSHLRPQKRFDFFDDESEFMSHVATPRSSCILDNSKLLATDAPMRGVHDAVAETLRSWTTHA